MAASKRVFLSEKVWETIIRRYVVDGEGASALAREYGVSEGAVRKRASTTKYEVKVLANHIVAVDQKYSKMDPSTKLLVDDMVSQLKLISGNLTRAAIASSDTSAKLSLIVNQQVNKIDPENPLGNEEIIKSIAGMTRMANDASVIGIALVNASHRAPKELTENDDLANALNNLIESMPN